jgi:phosphate/sulfate permease
MSAEMIILVLLIATALAFDFTNGFHDTGNAMATSIATGALKPKTAVLLAGVLNLVGAFLSVEVAVTVTTSVLKVQDSKSGHLLPGIDPSMGLTIIFAGLIGGILWNLLTWLFGIPSSSSHALFGGLIGAGLAALGTAGVNWAGVTQKVLIPAVAAPVIACLVAACGTWLVYRLTQKVIKKRREDGFRWGQIATASLVALSHGTNDAQKTMGVIALALITTGHLTGDVKKDGLPFWVILSCALAIGLGTYIGGWRVIGCHHPELERCGHGPVHHACGDGLDPRQWRRQARCRGALGGRRPDGGGLAGHAARRRTRRSAVLLDLAHRRGRDHAAGWRRPHLPHPGGPVRLHLVACPAAEGGQQQRQRRLG